MLRKSLTVVCVAALCALPLALTACGSSSDSSSSSTTTSSEASGGAASGSGSGSSSTVAVSESEYKLDPSDPTAKAGSVTLTATNDGSITHNLTIEGNGIEEEATDDLSPGQSGDVTVDLKPGTYEIYCSIDSHKDMGMEGTLTVQ